MSSNKLLRCNDQFSKLNSLDLKQLIDILSNNYLVYRNSLYLPKDITFGVEIEHEKVKSKSVDKFLSKSSKYSKYILTNDISLDSGSELVSPVLTDEKINWIILSEICKFLTKKKANTSENAAGHIHVGAAYLGYDVESWRIYLKLRILYEQVLLRFYCGDKVNARRRADHFAPPCSLSLYNNLNLINKCDDLTMLHWHATDNIFTKKYSALSFCHTKWYDLENAKIKNTIEERYPNATTNEIIWQNNINTAAKILVASKSKTIDEELLDYKIAHEFVSYKENKLLYTEVNLQKVLEFVDLIFDNDLDKMYFLRQYLKDFELAYGKIQEQKLKSLLDNKKIIKKEKNYY